MIIDSHCHLVSYKYQPDEISQIILNATSAGVSKIITLSTSLDDANQHLEIASTYDQVYACIGIHPCDVTNTPADYLSKLEPLITHKKCVAVGETGLDFFHPAPDGWSEINYRQKQIQLLEEHFSLAAKHNKNIVIHTRDKIGTDSLDACLAIYEKWADKVTAVFHCFLGPLTNAKRIFELGGIISFTGISTFKSAKDCHQAAKDAPKGKFMLETDAPYLAPTPHRGKRCEPAHVSIIAQHIAELRGETFEQLAQHTSKTALDFYKI